MVLLNFTSFAKKVAQSEFHVHQSYLLFSFVYLTLGQVLPFLVISLQYMSNALNPWFYVMHGLCIFFSEESIEVYLEILDLPDVPKSLLKTALDEGVDRMKFRGTQWLKHRRFYWAGRMPSNKVAFQIQAILSVRQYVCKYFC